MNSPATAASKGAGQEHRGLSKMAIATVSRTCLALPACGRLRKRQDSAVLVL